MTIFEPLLEIVRSEATTALVTDAALNAVMELLASESGVFGNHNSGDFEEVLELTAEAATHCRFEASSDDMDEVVLYSILKLLRCCLFHELGAKLEDETVYGMVQTCVRLALQTRFSSLLRRAAEITTSDMMCLLFARLIPSVKGAANQEPERHDLMVGQELSNEIMLERILIQVKEAEDSNADASVAGVVNSQRVQFSKESNTVKKMLESGLSVSCKLFKFICSLLDRTKPANSDNSVLFAFAVIRAIILKFGGELQHVPGLLSIVQDDMFQCLLQNLQTDNFLILSGSLSLTRNLFVFLTKHVKLQMELVISKLIEWNMSEGVPYQKQEITMEFLVDLLRVPNFVAEIYINYDCDPNCTDLFEKIAMFLYKNSYPPDGALYTTHVLTLEGLLSIAQSISDHIDNSPNNDGDNQAFRIDPELVKRRKVKRNDEDIIIHLLFFGHSNHHRKVF